MVRLRLCHYAWINSVVLHENIIAAWMFNQEISDVVDDAFDEDPAVIIEDVLFEVSPSDGWFTHWLE